MIQRNQPSKRNSHGALGGRYVKFYLLALCLLTLTLYGTTGAQVAQSSRSGNHFTLALREHAGPYRFWKTLEAGHAYRKAVAAFGMPTAVGRDRPDSNLCTVRWERIGVDVGFAGASGGCAARNLHRAAWYGMRLWGPRWITARGLQVGDPVSRIRRLYPRATYASRPPRPGEWWLITERQGELGRKPLLVAEVGAGRVVAIRVPAGYVF